MAKRKLSDEQILNVVKQLDAGRTAAEVAREVGVSTYTIYAWKAKYGGMDSNDAVKLRRLSIARRETGELSACGSSSSFI